MPPVCHSDMKSWPVTGILDLRFVKWTVRKSGLDLLLYRLKKMLYSFYIMLMNICGTRISGRKRTIWHEILTHDCVKSYAESNYYKDILFEIQSESALYSAIGVLMPAICVLTLVEMCFYSCMM